jgi:YihY family inner membrane protein
MLISAVTAMAQLQRGSSRIYGVDGDRTTLRRYGLATVLALTAGLLLTVAFVFIALGGSVRSFFDDGVARLWGWFRWPVGILALTAGLATLFKFAPNRRQPRVTWLATGGSVAAIGCVLVSVALSFYLNASGTFGDTYGPLAGIIGLALWAQLSAIAILYGVAVAAELEAQRAGVEEPHQHDDPTDEFVDRPMGEQEGLVTA